MISSQLQKSPAHTQHFFKIQLHRLLNHQPQQQELHLTLFKGQQKYDEIKSNIITQKHQQNADVSQHSLYFVIFNYSAARNPQFKLSLSKVEKGRMEIGHHFFKGDHYIEEYNKMGRKSFSEKITLSNQYQLEYTVYVEKSKISLQQYIESVKAKEQQLPEEAMEGSDILDYEGQLLRKVSSPVKISSIKRTQSQLLNSEGEKVKPKRYEREPLKQSQHEQSRNNCIISTAMMFSIVVIYFLLRYSL